MSIRHGPCYRQPYPWGTGITPKNPRGWYQPLYQIYDANNIDREYPAAIAQCAGLTVKADKFWAGEFDQVVSWMNFGFQWAPYIAGPGIWRPFTALYMALHSVGYISYPYYWDVLWSIHFDANAQEPWYVVQSRVQAPNTTRRLGYGVSYPWNAAPWSNDLVPAQSLVISNGSVWGDIWDNPV